MADEPTLCCKACGALVAEGECSAGCAAYPPATLCDAVPCAKLDPPLKLGDPVAVDSLRMPDDARAALLDLWSRHVDASVRAEIMGALVRYLDAVGENKPA
jgi:hypothetical protein